MGFEESDRQEQRAIAWPAQHFHCERCDRVDMCGWDLHHLVVADHVGLLGDVLFADQHRRVAGTAKHVDDVMRVVA
jgi:hypothetical protein